MNGSIAWALRDFRVAPDLAGRRSGRVRPPPWHNKSLIEETNQPEARLLRVRKRLAAHEAARLSLRSPP